MTPVLSFLAEVRFLGLDGDQLGVLAVGSLVGASCALVGSFLVLRRVAMLGDAISHAVLPAWRCALTASRRYS